MKDIQEGLKEIASEDSEILILGFAPGIKTLNENKKSNGNVEYYKDSRNQFWDIITKIFCGEVIKLDNKLEFLKKYKIALWDVYKTFSVKTKENSSLDNNRNGEEFNNLKEFLCSHPNIKVILLNGRKAEKAFKKYIKKENLKYNYEYVVSSSGMIRKSVEYKACYWSKKIFKLN